MAGQKSTKSPRVAKKTAAKPAAAPASRPRKAAPKTAVQKPAAPKSPPRQPAQPVLLSGGNPQIAKGDGDAPVQAYIAAMPGWKQAVGRRLDALIERTIPGVQKAIKWNTPFYGLEGPDGKPNWFLGFHCITKYIKVAFFRGTSLHPLPPIASKQKAVRYLHLHEHDALDEEQFMDWLKQASHLPGERL
jgi:hypothetical protein